MIKKYKNNIIKICLITGILLLISLLNYVFIPVNVTKHFILLLSFCLFFILSFKYGKKRDNKGYIAGFKVSLIGILSFVLVNLIIIHNTINIKTIIYYLLIILISIYGSIIGINKKQVNGH